MIGGLPRSREKGVSIWITPSLRRCQNSDLDSWRIESLPCLCQPRSPLLSPPVLVLDIVGIIQLIALGFVTENDNANAPSIQNAKDDWTDPVDSTGTKINRVCGGLWEIDGLGPVEGKCENLFRDGPRNRGSRTPEIGPCKRTELE